MNYVLNQMERSIVLSAEDIARFKQYISEKYADLTGASRAEVLANSLWRVLDRYLEGIEQTYRLSIGKSLFKKTLASSKNQISKKDIFSEIVSLEITKEEICETALHWMHKNVDEELKFDDVRSFIEEIIAPIPSFNVNEFLEMIYLKSDNEAIVFEAEADEVIAYEMATFEEAYEVEAVYRMTDATDTHDMDLGKEERAKRKDLLIKATLCALMFLVILKGLIVPSYHFKEAIEGSSTSEQTELTVMTEMEKISRLPAVFAYKSFDAQKLRDYLVKSNSKLADSPYYETIIETAKAHGIDPRLLFAITGQEQSLVRNDNAHVEKIANNPFNVFGSWQDYNTDIADSSNIACNTIVNSMARRPAEIDPIIWLNSTYAEDKNWNVGVRKFFDRLCSISE